MNEENTKKLEHIVDTIKNVCTGMCFKNSEYQMREYMTYLTNLIRESGCKCENMEFNKDTSIINCTISVPLDKIQIINGGD